MPVVVTDSPATRGVHAPGLLTAWTVRLTGRGTRCASTCTSRPATDIIAGVAERLIGLPGRDARSDLAGGAGRRLPTLRAVVVAVVLVLLGASSCATPSGPTAVRFVPVDLPAGAAPEVLVAAGQDVLVGVRVDDREPRLLRLSPDAVVTEVPVLPATGYGRTAAWYSVVSDGRRVLAVGGDRGGAHGNVRWSVWSGSLTGVREQPQAFSTFGGWGAGDLIDGVLTPDSAAVVGSWQSSGAGLDVAVWTVHGDTWSRTDSTGTPLASSRESLGFATDATGFGPGIVVAGWQVGGGNGPAPVVWQSTALDSGWTRTPLPDAGVTGAATSVRCAGNTCAVAGRVDGVLALWRLTDGAWSRVPGVPVLRVGDADPLPAPLDPSGPLIQAASEGPAVRIIRMDGPTAAVHPAEGPTGPATAVVEAGGSVYLLAGPDEHTRRLWRADAAAFR